MYVYFITTGRGSGKRRLKIGKANDPEKRLKQLQTANSIEIKIQGIIKCKSEQHAFQIEKAAHEYFKDYHIRGEWFKLSDFVLCKIWEFTTKFDYNYGK